MDQEAARDRLASLRVEYAHARQVAEGLKGWASELTDEDRVESMLGAVSEWRRKARNIRRRIRRIEAVEDSE